MTKNEKTIIKKTLTKLNEQLIEAQSWYDFEGESALEHKIEILEWVLSISESED